MYCQKGMEGFLNCERLGSDWKMYEKIICKDVPLSKKYKSLLPLIFVCMDVNKSFYNITLSNADDSWPDDLRVWRAMHNCLIWWHGWLHSVFENDFQNLFAKIFRVTSFCSLKWLQMYFVTNRSDSPDLVSFLSIKFANIISG